MSALETVLDMRLTHERSCAIAMNEAQSIYQDAARSQQELQDLYDRPAPPLSTPGYSQAMALSRSVLEMRLNLAYRATTAAQTNLEEMRTLLAKAMADRKSIELVLESRRRERDLATARLEQRDTDDLALSRYTRGKSVESDSAHEK